MESYFIGIDVGTQGARAVLITSAGTPLASAARSFELNSCSREEQSPQVWWESVMYCLHALSVDAEAGVWSKVSALAVTSTSGTVIPLDKDHKPLHNALMYSDKRSVLQADWCMTVAQKYVKTGFKAFNSSSALAKIIWFQESYPEKNKLVMHWAHASDYITGMLSGVWDITDYTNALKTGYDLRAGEWPAYLFKELKLRKECLPGVVPSGQVIGRIRIALAGELGLPSELQITTGMTDGCASQIASGAVKPGDWNTTIGTTMVVKGVTKNEISDPQGRIYNHRHPAGYWMPGGASNTGADWITTQFSRQLDLLNQAAVSLVPTGLIAYPLKQRGERFPMIAPQALGFEPEGLSDAESFAANLEGVAYLEKYALRMMRHLTGEEINAVYTAGGGSNSEIWLKIRSSVLNLPIYKMREVSGAVGAAILAASGTVFGNLETAVQAMTTIDRLILPDPVLVAAYQEYYQLFLNKMVAEGYIRKEETYA